MNNTLMILHQREKVKEEGLMKIREMKLNNFRGIKELTVNFDGKNAAIFGANGTGKTTVANAFCWLLTGKSVTGEKNFSPKTVGMKKAEHSAEAVFVSDDGANTISLKKVFKEKWKKPRGQEAVLAGHETILYVNDIKVKDSEYQEAIERLLPGIGNIEALTIAGHFTEELSVKERRNVLFQLFNGSIENLIDLPEFMELKESLEGRSVEDFRKFSEASRKQAQAWLDEAPASISLLESTKENVIESNIEAVQEELHAEEEKLHSLIAAAGSSDKETEKARLKRELEEAEYQYKVKQRELEEAWSTQLRTEKMALTAESDAQFNAKHKITAIEKQIEEQLEEQEKLRKAFRNVAGKKWDEAQAVCPTCHRPLPADETQQMRAEFEENRASIKADIVKKGNQLSEIIKQLEAEKAEAKKEVEVLEKSIAFLHEAIHKLRANEPINIPYNQTAEYAAKFKEYKAKLASLEGDGENSQPEDNREKIEALKQEIEKHQDYLAKLKGNANIELKIAEIKEQKKVMLKRLEGFEKAVYMADTLMDKRAKMAEDEINSHFSCIKFKLFEPQVNGGMKEVCEPLIPNRDGQMVDYKSANTAAQINANLEIMEALAKAYGVSVPIFIDGAERVSKIRSMDCQTIALVVSAKDKELRVEACE